MSYIISCTMVLQTNNISKAGKIKNHVLSKIPLEFVVKRSELNHNNDSQWLFELEATYDFDTPEQLTYSILGMMARIFEVYSVRGPIIEEAQFKGLFVHHIRKEHGAEVHHCLEEFHIMALLQ